MKDQRVQQAQYAKSRRTDDKTTDVKVPTEIPGCRFIVAKCPSNPESGLHIRERNHCMDYLPYRRPENGQSKCKRVPLKHPYRHPLGNASLTATKLHFCNTQDGLVLHLNTWCQN